MTEPLPELPASIRFQHTGTTAQLRIAQRGFKGARFLSLWMFIWSGGWIALACLAVQKQDPRVILALIPFGLAWCLGLAGWMYVNHRRIAIELSPSGLTFRAFAGPITTAEGTISLAHLRSFCTHHERHEDEDGVNEQWLVVPDSLGPRWPLFQSKVQAEGKSVAAALNRILAAVRTRSPDRFQEELLGSSWPTEALSITKRDEPLLVVPPTHWEQEGEGLDFTFRWSKPVRVLDALNVAFAALFWNSIVGFLIYGLLTSGFDSKLLVVLGLFLSLFVLIGLLLMATAVGSLVPGWTQRWLRIRDEQIEQGYRWGPYVWQKHWPLSEIAAVELRPASPPAVRGAHKSPTAAAVSFMQGQYQLVFLDSAAKVLTYLGDLHEGEGRWLGGQLVQVLDPATNPEPEPAVASF